MAAGITETILPAGQVHAYLKKRDAAFVKQDPSGNKVYKTPGGTFIKVTITGQQAVLRAMTGSCNC